MKIQHSLFILTIAALLSFSTKSFGQMPDLGTAGNYVIFTSVGALGNTGISNVTGNMGTDNGAITGFEPPTMVNGTIDSGNSITTQVKADLQAAYDELFNTPATNTGHAPAYGGNETLFPGVYAIAAAGSVAGNLILDAQGDANAIFIFKFGGAFTTGASTTIILLNDASACNIFWIAEGAISMAASTTMKGTLISNNGAVSMGAEGSLEGRLMSTAGAATIYQVSVSSPCEYVVVPIQLYSFKGICEGENVVLEWITATEINNSYFTIERSINGFNWQFVGRVEGAGNSSSQLTYTLTDNLPNREDLLYRLKQTDLDGNYKYARTIRINQCGNKQAELVSLFPNPTNGNVALRYTGNPDHIMSIEILNIKGQRVSGLNRLERNFDLSAYTPGVYFMRLQLPTGFVNLQIVVIK